MRALGKRFIDVRDERRSLMSGRSVLGAAALLVVVLGFVLVTSTGAEQVHALAEEFALEQEDA